MLQLEKRAELQLKNAELFELYSRTFPSPRSHAFVVINRPEDSDPCHFKAWNKKETIICDPALNRYFLANQISQELHFFCYVDGCNIYQPIENRRYSLTIKLTLNQIQKYYSKKNVPQILLDIMVLVIRHQQNNWLRYWSPHIKNASCFFIAYRLLQDLQQSIVLTNSNSLSFFNIIKNWQRKNIKQFNVLLQKFNPWQNFVNFLIWKYQSLEAGAKILKHQFDAAFS